ncbi:membrane protein [Maribacter cobaltidurans]|nr:membrane protein [Maribacter cobaltidurans]
MITASVLGFLAVALGAFGAHGLEKLVEPDAVSTFETGVRYQMYHAFFLFILGILPGISERTQRIVYRLVLTGVVFFSFSIYFLALNSITTFDFKSIGFITPIGGSLLLAAWGYLGYQLYRSKLN